MNKKRFTYKHFDWLQWHIYKDGSLFIEVTNCEADAKKLCDLLNSLCEENEWLKDKINHYDKVWVKQLERELEIIEENLGFIQPFLQDPVMTRFTAPYFSEKTRLLERRWEIKQILKEIKDE